MLKVHTAANIECINRIKHLKFTPVRWAEQLQLSQKEFVLLHIDSDAHYGILRDGVDIVYKEPGIQLWSAEAHTDGKVNTHITFGIKTDSLANIGNVQANLENIRGVRRVFSSLPSPSQFLALKPSQIKEHHNP